MKNKKILTFLLLSLCLSGCKETDLIKYSNAFNYPDNLIPSDGDVIRKANYDVAKEIANIKTVYKKSYAVIYYTEYIKEMAQRGLSYNIYQESKIYSNNIITRKQEGTIDFSYGDERLHLDKASIDLENQIDYIFLSKNEENIYYRNQTNEYLLLDKVENSSSFVGTVENENYYITKYFVDNIIDESLDQLFDLVDDGDAYNNDDILAFIEERDSYDTIDNWKHPYKDSSSTSEDNKIPTIQIDYKIAKYKKINNVWRFVSYGQKSTMYAMEDFDGNELEEYIPITYQEDISLAYYEDNGEFNNIPTPTVSNEDPDIRLVIHNEENSSNRYTSLSDYTMTYKANHPDFRGFVLGSGFTLQNGDDIYFNFYEGTAVKSCYLSDATLNETVKNCFKIDNDGKYKCIQSGRYYAKAIIDEEGKLASLEVDCLLKS